MDRFPYDAETRETALRKLLVEHETRLTAAFNAGDPKVTKQINERLGDYLADDHALAEVAREALGGVNSMQLVVQNVIFTEAEALAEKDMADIEKRRAQAAQDERIQQRVWERFFTHGVPV